MNTWLLYPGFGAYTMGPWKEDHPDGRYIPKRSSVIKNKKRNANKKGRKK